MRGSIIWFVLALAWGVDGVLAAVHRNHLQAVAHRLFRLLLLSRRRSLPQT